MLPETPHPFTDALIRWQQQHGRHHLPWLSDDPYRVWLSEIMLQQTQVVTVLDYYPRFIQRFPDVHHLAAAPVDEVLALWAGLGYYSRARNLHRAAQQVVHEWGGQFPSNRKGLEQLTGVGRSTAAAIAAFAFRQPEAILDGNVKRVLCRVFAQDGAPEDKAFEARLWALAEALLPTAPADMPGYTQGLMDLGATLCKRHQPLCGLCPMQNLCLAHQQNRTDELPRRKKPPQVSAVTLYWLVLINQKQEILLQRRPAKGIWGGLFCVPCTEDWHTLQPLLQACGLSSDELTEDTAISHRLTHRQLHIMPFYADRLPETDPGAAYQWYALSQLAQMGLPKPLYRYLQQRLNRMC